MTTIEEIMRWTGLRFGIDHPGILYLKITNKNEGADPPAYCIRWEDSTSVLRRIEKGDKLGPIIPPEEHDNHIENFAEVILYANNKAIRKENIDDYLKDIFSAI